MSKPIADLRYAAYCGRSFSTWRGFRIHESRCMTCAEMHEESRIYEADRIYDEAEARIKADQLTRLTGGQL